MLKIKDLQDILNEVIKKTEQDCLCSEEKSKEIIYSQKRTSETILEETSNLLLIKKRLLSLKKLNQSLILIKKEDEYKDSTQKLLREINTILQSI